MSLTGTFNTTELTRLTAGPARENETLAADSQQQEVDLNIRVVLWDVDIGGVVDFGGDLVALVRAASGLFPAQRLHSFPR